MCYTGLTHTDPARLIAGFNALLARREPFVLLTDDAPSGDDRGGDDHDLRKQLAKRNKTSHAQSREWVPAMIAIEPDAVRHVMLNAFPGALGKVWGCPLNAAITRDNAFALAQRLLDEPARYAVATSG